MLKHISYKQRLKLLPFGFVIFLILIYLVAIRDTLKLKDDCNKLSAQSSIANDAPQQLIFVKKQIDEINMISGENRNSSETDPFLEFIGNSKSKTEIMLVDYQPTHIFQNGNYQIETRVAISEGSFKDLLTFLYLLERDFKLGKIVSVKFQTETNHKTERKRLIMTLYIQFINSTGVKNIDAASKSN